MEPSEKAQPQPFTTQKYMLQHHGSLELGMCNQLTNAFMETCIRGEDPSSLINNEHLFYEKAQEQSHIQKKMLSENKPNFRYPAFESNHIPYEIEQGKYGELTNANKIEGRVGTSRYTFFSIPTGNGNYHMTGLTKDGNTCQFFDADFPGGIIKSDCRKIFAYMAKLNKDIYSKNPLSETVIAKSKN
ncbi:MAG: hypothetical protein QM652_11930 [Legionella sp.]|uniref:hypothetical protein n=1 Tax=Legionella sp. TaxID=459 RepID=UPI0039E706C8